MPAIDDIGQRATPATQSHHGTQRQRLEQPHQTERQQI